MGDIPSVSVTDIKILVAIIVKITKQGCPAPVGTENSGILTDLGKITPMVIQLQHVTGRLMIKPGVFKNTDFIIIIRPRNQFLFIIVFGVHVEG
jgi:hypothetical protein